ncbi:MAG: RNA polymerase sigma factor [Firmicutes bacterium]|nr:RNA polymerase sigma factor [Bacillota bacterium]
MCYTVLTMLLFTLITDAEKDLVSASIPRIAQGDEAALVAVYHAVGGRLLSVAMGITRDIHLAEDAVSESFIKLVRSAGQFRGGNGYAWLCTIVRNTALNILKSRNLRREADIDGFFSLSGGLDFTKGSETAVMVEDALKKLSKEERLCIWLKYFNDFTVRQIAAESGISKSSVQDLIKKAEKKLKEYLE